MFLRYFTEIPLPYGEVGRRLLEDPGLWIPGLVHEAHERGEALLAEVGFGGPVARLRKRVRVEIDAPARLDTKALLPMRWIPTSAGSLFPALEGDLEIAPLGSRGCQLSVTARYTPPLGRLGKAGDRALLHRVAEATVKDFVLRVAEALSTPAPAAST
jgi:hypothetical protein